MSHLLSSTAHQNKVQIESGASVIVTGALLGDFRTQAAYADMGTAVWAFKLVIFNDLLRIACAREISEHHPGRPAGMSADDWYVTSQGRHYPMRKAFEDHWIDGDRAVYFALLLGGAAPANYGTYTLVVDPARCADLDLACFPGNTAERYALHGTLEIELCRSEIAPWDSRGSLLIIKHHARLPSDKAEWPTVVCDGDDFSEAVAIGALPLGAIREVRVRKADHRRWRKLRVDKLSGALLSPEEQLQVEMLDLLAAWKDRFGTPIVAI